MVRPDCGWFKVFGDFMDGLGILKLIFTSLDISSVLSGMIVHTCHQFLVELNRVLSIVERIRNQLRSLHAFWLFQLRKKKYMCRPSGNEQFRTIQILQCFPIKGPWAFRNIHALHCKIMIVSYQTTQENQSQSSS